MPTSKAPLICLCASGGGHFRQLLDLKPLWSRYPHFFVSEATVLARSIAEQEDMEFVPHFALGQSRMGKFGTMIGNAAVSMFRSFRIIAKRRPDYVITTGAGSQVFILLWARMFGAKVFLVDSFARFKAPSKFARFAAPLANFRISQSAEAAQRWRGALAFDPLRRLEAGSNPSAKENLLFATVGTILPFDRLSQMVFELKREGRIAETVILQTGRGARKFETVDGLDVVEELPFAEVDRILARASLVVGHAGTGSMITALARGCRVVTVPRRVEFNDSYDNHQLQIAETFAERGLVQVAEDKEALAAALDRARKAKPTPVEMDHSALIAFIDERIGGAAYASRPVLTEIVA